MELPYDEPQTFGCFAQWISQQNEDSVVVSDFELTKEMKMKDLTNAWIFGERIRTSRFQNFVMDLILARFKEYHGTNIALETFNHVYNNTLAGSQLRRVFVDFAAQKMSPSWYNLNKSELEVDFLEELCLVQMTRDRYSVNRTRDAENKFHNFFYHVEDDEAIKEQQPMAGEVSEERQMKKATREQMEARKVLTVKSVKRRYLNVPQL